MIRPGLAGIYHLSPLLGRDSSTYKEGGPHSQHHNLLGSRRSYLRVSNIYTICQKILTRTTESHRTACCSCLVEMGVMTLIANSVISPKQLDTAKKQKGRHSSRRTATT